MKTVTGVNAPGRGLARYLNEGDLDMIVGGHHKSLWRMEGPNVIKKNFWPVMNAS